MPFFQNNRTNIYFDITNTPKVFRPLAREAITKFIYSIPGCSVIGPDNQKHVLRKYKTVDTESTRWLKTNPDPMWERLAERDKWKKDGGRQDFAQRPNHILPVWSYADNDVKIMKAGNQSFEEMNKYYELGGDVTACDWMIWTENGPGGMKKYLTSRLDAKPFAPSVPLNNITPKVQASIDQALSDLRPFKSDDEVIKYVNGQSEAGSASFAFGANAPQQALPVPTAYTPGGVSQAQLGAPPVMQQPVYTPPQVNVAPYQPAPQMQQPAYMPQQVPQVAYNPGMPQQVYQQPTPSYVPPQAYTAPQTPVAQQFIPQTMQQSVNTTMFQPNGSTQPLNTMVQPQVDVPNAPVAAQPVFAPAPDADQKFTVSQSGNPAELIVEFGKHAGKTLGWIKDNDPSYLTFVRSNKKPLAPYIDALLGANTTVQYTPPQAQQVPQVIATQPMSLDADMLRSQLVKEINDKLMNKIPEFSGRGIHEKMMPFLMSTIGTHKFTDAPLDQLQVLKVAVDAKIAQIGV